LQVDLSVAHFAVSHDQIAFLQQVRPATPEVVAWKAISTEGLVLVDAEKAGEGVGGNRMG
jgi:hypothetical protein